MVKRTIPDQRRRARAWLSCVLAALLVGAAGCATTKTTSTLDTTAHNHGAAGGRRPAPGQATAPETAPSLPPVIEARALPAAPPAAAAAAAAGKVAAARTRPDSDVTRVAGIAAAPPPAAPVPVPAPAATSAPSPALAPEPGVVLLELAAPASLPPLPPLAVPVPTSQPAELSDAPVDDGAIPAQCATCGGAGRLADLGVCGTCGGSGQCVPGQKPCHDIPTHTIIGRFLAELYHCICCPDPCYQPTWVPEANSAFFVDYARPQTLTRFRWDNGHNMQFPDRNEFFWARAGLNRMNQFVGNGPMVPNVHLRNGHPLRSWIGINWDQLSYYQEAATGRASIFVELPYRSWSSILGPSHGGFSDMNVGTKTLLLDCELLQFTFQFRTYIPTGTASMGLGTGHVSVEPSLLLSLHLARQTYLQAQVSEWLPFAAPPSFAGAIFHHHASLNQVIWRCAPDVPLIAMVEYNGWTFQNGAFSAPVIGPVKSSGVTYWTVGPSLRLSVCKRIDLGAAVAYPASQHFWADPQIRSEIRFIY